jgi:hypothetical protein|tara:strand:- start:44 stop:259 length:216 start_codon:yes stop_codon:yes gene_type:complete
MGLNQEVDLHEAKRTYSFTFNIECASDGKADLEQVEHLLDLHLQELVMDDSFIAELDEGQAVTIQVLTNPK